MDKIRLKNIELYAYHGVSPEEQKLGQRFELDIELTSDFSTIDMADDITKTVNYEEVYKLTKQIFCNNKWKLLETAASEVAKGISDMNKIQNVNVKIRKLNPPIPGFMGCFEVECNHGRTS